MHARIERRPAPAAPNRIQGHGDVRGRRSRGVTAARRHGINSIPHVSSIDPLLPPAPPPAAMSRPESHDCTLFIRLTSPSELEVPPNLRNSNRTRGIEGDLELKSRPWEARSLRKIDLSCSVLRSVRARIDKPAIKRLRKGSRKRIDGNKCDSFVEIFALLPLGR